MILEIGCNEVIDEDEYPKNSFRVLIDLTSDVTSFSHQIVISRDELKLLRANIYAILIDIDEELNFKD